jgi:hypothetical protein
VLDAEASLVVILIKGFRDDDTSALRPTERIMTTNKQRNATAAVISFGAMVVAVSLSAFFAAAAIAADVGSFTFDPTTVAPAADAKWSRGEGRINGLDVPLYAYSGAVEANALFKSLEESCKGRCTVTRETTDMSEVFVIANVASDLCPKCQPLNAQTAPTLFDDAWAVSVIRAGDGANIALASPVGPLIARFRLEPADAPKLEFEGKAGSSLAPDLRLNSQATYQFAKTRVHFTSGSLGLDLDSSYARVGDALRRDGYGRIEGDEPRGENDLAGVVHGNSTRRRGTWVKGNTAVQVQVDGVLGSPNAMVVIHEVQAE